MTNEKEASHRLPYFDPAALRVLVQTGNAKPALPSIIVK